jgi:hypothetical protein
MAELSKEIGLAASAVVTETLEAIGRKPGDNETTGVVLERALKKFAGAILEQAERSARAIVRESEQAREAHIEGLRQGAAETMQQAIGRFPR